MLRINATKTCQQKAMPLPIPYPKTDAEDLHRVDYGAREINEKMRQETADEQKSLFPDMEFKGSGGFGMAVNLGNGKIGKYTDKRAEVNNALKVKGKIFLVLQQFTMSSIFKRIQDKEDSWSMTCG